MLAFRAALVVTLRAAGPAQNDLFQRGTEGYHTFHIPALLATPLDGDKSWPVGRCLALLGPGWLKEP